jgi:hypothetical protein
MRQILLPFMTVLAVLFTFNGCSDEVPVQGGSPLASVVFDFWAGARTVEVDGEIFNDGSTHINQVEIEIALYDEFGQYINSTYQSFSVDLRPRDSFVFSTDIRENAVYDVEVLISTFW